MDDAAGHLRFLKRLLEDEDDSGELPTTYPPKPRWERYNGDSTSNHNTFNFNAEESSATAALINGMPQLTISTNNGTSNNTNHFAAFNDDEDEDDDDVGGDTIVYQTQQQQQNANNNNHQSSKNMSAQRILLRIYCSLAEIHSTKAVNCSKSRPAEWMLGADEFQSAHIILRSGH